jgi:GNAT-family acetyltransferase (TIGR03103 family)
MQPVDPESSPSLKHWGSKPTEDYYNDVQNDAYVECGWGRLIFAHTFKANKNIAKLMRGEAERMRDIAFYVHDPQLIISYAPHEFFLDPSLTYRFDLAHGDIDAADPVNFAIEKADFKKDLGAINAIYLAHHMVPVDSGHMGPEGKVTFFVAKDVGTGEVVGCAMGADHVEIFDDSEAGSSLWALAVDPKTRYPGVGRALVKHILAFYKGKGRRFLDLSVMSGSGAITLYEQMGFNQVPAFTVKRKNAINEKLYTPPVNSEKLNPYAMIIINEAKLRGIGIEVLDEENNYFKLTYGGRSIICRESLSELTSAVAMSRCADKAITHHLLKPLRVSMPAQRTVDGSDDDYKFLQQYGHIAVKPADGEQGHGISLLVHSNAEMELAIRKAKKVSSKVVLEEYVEGEDLRIVVINFEVVAAAIRRPAEVVGDGIHTVRELIKNQSRRRELATQGESCIPMDDETKRTVFSAGFSMDDVPDAHVKLQVRKTANLHTGGTIHDVTDELHPALGDAAVAISAAIDIPVVGIDFMVKAPDKEDYYFIEANERPGLANHEPRPTAQKFVDLLFPNTIIEKEPL